MNTPSNKLIKAFQLITKVFLGADSEKSLEYTFEKNSLKLFGCLKNFHEFILNIFNNLGLSDLSTELDLFLWKIIGCALPKNFDLSTSGNELEVTF